MNYDFLKWKKVILSKNFFFFARYLKISLSFILATANQILYPIRMLTNEENKEKIMRHLLAYIV